jgi:hypothetical protein
MLSSCEDPTNTTSSRMGNTSSSMHTKENKNSLVSAIQAKKLIISSKKYALLFLRENHSGE